MMWFVPGGQCVKAHARSRRSCPSTEQQAFAGEHEEVFLLVLAVVHAHRLTGLEDVQVDPELVEPLLALEVAEAAQVPRIPPAALARVDDEPALAVGREAELRLAERDL